MYFFKIYCHWCFISHPVPQTITALTVKNVVIFCLKESFILDSLFNFFLHRERNKARSHSLILKMETQNGTWNMSSTM